MPIVSKKAWTTRGHHVLLSRSKFLTGGHDSHWISHRMSTNVDPGLKDKTCWLIVGSITKNYKSSRQIIIMNHHDESSWWIIIIIIIILIIILILILIIIILIILIILIASSSTRYLPLQTHGFPTPLSTFSRPRKPPRRGHRSAPRRKRLTPGRITSGSENGVMIPLNDH